VFYSTECSLQQQPQTQTLIGQYGAEIWQGCKFPAGMLEKNEKKKHSDNAIGYARSRPELAVVVKAHTS